MLTHPHAHLLWPGPHVRKLAGESQPVTAEWETANRTSLRSSTFTVSLAHASHQHLNIPNQLYPAFVNSVPGSPLTIWPGSYSSIWTDCRVGTGGSESTYDRGDVLTRTIQTVNVTKGKRGDFSKRRIFFSHRRWQGLKEPNQNTDSSEAPTGKLLTIFLRQFTNHWIRNAVLKEI